MRLIDWILRRPKPVKSVVFDGADPHFFIPKKIRAWRNHIDGRLMLVVREQPRTAEMKEFVAWVKVVF